ncbi:cation diffusion facilitator family transporter [Thermomonospora echinospora]|uniref:Cation diffusion facilitator family transporter n=1 Tax=Thermomonospora echinospora TaxID=1992 RepID=A0A1H6DJ05_9ACTN|nr:cation diffusion facilitator family transporter [Thermomonospora echinospora]SEG85447.1 cation diffusion facilitator family transporter [Thermomonospora echinospora]
MSQPDKGDAAPEDSAPEPPSPDAGGAQNEASGDPHRPPETPSPIPKPAKDEAAPDTGSPPGGENPPGGGSGETRKTVLAAGGANIAIAVTKLVAGLVAGSSAMLAEAAHSLADTLNQLFLLASLRRSERPADRRHPFGYGKERYFWSLIAAVGIFVAGGGYSIYEGVREIISPGEHGEATVAFVVLAFAFLFEGLSLARAVYQVRKEAADRSRPPLDHVRKTPDTTLKAAVLEDSAALVGLTLAAAGLTLREITGSGVWDGAASVLIGLLLVVVAVTLGRSSMDLLIGQSVDRETLRTIHREIADSPGVSSVVELLTMYLGPDELLVAAKVAFWDEISADQAEDIADEIDVRLRDRLPIIRHVFLDPTQLDPARPPGVSAHETTV